MGSDGTNNPPFERKDLDMSNPADRAVSANLQRARGERLASASHSRKLDAIGREERAKLKKAGQEYEKKRPWDSGEREPTRGRERSR